MKKIFLSLIFTSLALFSMEVTVSIVPQKFFVEKIAKDKVKVNAMVQPGFSPATYEPKVSQMRELTKSSIYFSIDVPFENVWLEKFKNANKNMIVVDTADGIEKLAMAEHNHEEEMKHDEHEHHKGDHESHDTHKHEGLDPHIWLDPILVKTQAKNIYEALVKYDEKNASFYKTNYESFLVELDELNKKIHEILEPYEHKEFMVFHPSWGYFAKRYHLEQLAIEVQGKEPKPNELVEIMDDAKKHNIKIVFVSPQFSQKSAKTISKNINATVAVINPLSYNWDEELIKSATKIANSYK